jgi:hypothetical protein
MSYLCFELGTICATVKGFLRASLQDLRSRLEELVPLQRVRVPFILHLNASFIIIEKCTLKVIWPKLEPAFCGVLVIWRANVKDSKQERLKEIKKKYGKVSLGDTTVDMVCYTVLSCP